MKCADPVLCYTNKHSGKRVFRHYSLADKLFKIIHQQVYNCGKCLFCRKKKAYELAARCVIHASLYKQNCFLTLTYDEKKSSYHNNFQYEDIQKFKKKFRQYVCRNYKGKKVEIFNVHEYGKNGKKHWHLIIFNHDFSTHPVNLKKKDQSKQEAPRTIHTIKNGHPLYTAPILKKLWSHGHHLIGDVSEASAMYQAQYTQKDFKNNNVTSIRKSHSKHAGIGRPYFLKHYPQLLKLGYIPVNGKRLPLPRYFEKLAHKHYSHFYDAKNFYDTKERKALYRPFKQNEANKEIADLYILFKTIKEEKITQLAKEWEDFIEKDKSTNEKPEFVKSHENALYDLKNKNNIEPF